MVVKSEGISILPGCPGGLGSLMADIISQSPPSPWALPALGAQASQDLGLPPSPLELTRVHAASPPLSGGQAQPR